MAKLANGLGVGLELQPLHSKASINHPPPQLPTSWTYSAIIFEDLLQHAQVFEAINSSTHLLVLLIIDEPKSFVHIF